MQLHPFHGVDCFNDCNGVCAYTVLSVSTTANNYCRYFLRIFFIIEFYLCNNGVVCLNGMCATSFCTMCKGNVHLVFSAFFHDKHHKCKLCTSVVLCRVLALVIFEVKSNIVVIRRN